MDSSQMCSHKQLLDVLLQHVQLLAVEKHEQTSVEIRHSIVEYCNKSKELQDNLKEVQLWNEQLKKKRRIYHKILAEQKQEHIKQLMEDKNKFEELLENIQYNHLKLELKESMIQDVEVLIDDETKKYETEKEMIKSAKREFEIQAIRSSEVRIKLNEQKVLNETLKNELHDCRLELEQSQKLELENKVKLTIAEKFNQNFLRHKNDLMYRKNFTRREIESLDEVRLTNEVINRRIINTILVKNLIGITDNVKLLLLELDRYNQLFKQIKSEDTSRVVIANNKNQQTHIQHRKCDLKLADRNDKTSDSESHEPNSTISSSSLDVQKLKKSNSVLDLLQFRNTGGGDCNTWT